MANGMTEGYDIPLGTTSQVVVAVFIQNMSALLQAIEAAD